MLGNPKYDYDDKVKFTINHEGKDILLEGTIYIVDEYGTFWQDKEVSYDIMVDENNPVTGETPCLFKHIVETQVEKI